MSFRVPKRGKLLITWYTFGDLCTLLWSVIYLTHLKSKLSVLTKSSRGLSVPRETEAVPDLTSRECWIQITSFGRLIVYPHYRNAIVCCCWKDTFECRLLYYFWKTYTKQMNTIFFVPVDRARDSIKKRREVESNFFTYPRRSSTTAGFIMFQTHFKNVLGNQTLQ